MSTYPCCGAEKKWSRDNHAPDCPTRRHPAGKRRDRLASQHRSETMRAGVDVLAPPRVTQDSRVRTWLDHPSDCACGDCSYVNAHMDDDD